ncbi:hypothetical protein J2S00_000126 [Caldalkalibacillus uzonensis]|uniref:YwhD family protein n=1 Tax=Caldalkalibacillus uzonensis TaxID=353224 RepID=A0ABU0CLR5_9BACI|nr:YwhD family protein [Caldalkalibacillus uzonensis]MDQ0337356.1 hypothetical protein [Caldalkalibacillus uzonensis]
MDLLNNKKKGKSQFTILNNDSTDGHGGFGVGTLSLNDVSPVIIDVDHETAYVDMGALHARSEVEKRIKFLPNKDEVPGGRPYWVVWVTVDRNEDGPYYAGVAACEMTVDKEARRGYKNLAEHVNNMDKAIKRKIVVSHMDDKSKKILKEFLQGHNKEMWERASEQLKQELEA